MDDGMENLSLPAVAVWDDLSPEDRRTIVNERRPVILRGWVKSWPMVQAAQMSFAALARYLLSFDRKIPFYAMIAPPGEQGRLFYQRDLQTFNFKQMQGYLKDALDILGAQRGKKGGPAFYIGSTVIPDFLPGLEQECRARGLDAAVVPNLWMGNKTNVATHNDNAENLACIGAGRRRFTLFPPEQESNLYIGEQANTPGGRPVSLVNLCAPDFASFPRFRDALGQAQVAELEAGDALYIPMHWWHNVESLDDVNILVNFWWKGSPPNLLD